MATWRKVIVSGSNAELNQISASGNIVPVTDNTQTLGTAAKPFGDLFLGSGGVINLNNGDVTLTHASNLLTITGGSTRVDKLEIDSADDHIDVSTDMVKEVLSRGCRFLDFEVFYIKEDEVFSPRVAMSTDYKFLTIDTENSVPLVNILNAISISS